MFAYSSLAKSELPDKKVIVEGGVEGLSKEGTFVGQHILTTKPGVALHINAYNFPCWGMLEKLAPSIIAGMPVIVKPATVSCYLTEAMMREIVNSGILPEGSVQLICGSTGDIFDHLNEQDVVTFTGSASTGQMLKSHKNIVGNSIPFNMEADSLNCCILGDTVEPGSAEFDLYIKEIVREMSMKAGQKCTAIRRAIAPASKIDAVMQALEDRLKKTVIGDPAVEGVRMGALVGRDQVQDTPHSVEAFGPVCTVMPYNGIDEAVEIARLGKGSLAGSVFTANNQEARDIILGAAAYHGRLLVIDESCAKESTGHGTAMPKLVHGGPGRAGGGEELGGIRAVKHYMQRTALQGSPEMLSSITD